MLSSHLRLGLPSGLIPSGFPTKTLYTPLPSQTCYMTQASHSSLFNHPKNLGEDYRLLSCLICIFLHSFVTSSLLGLNILLNTPFSNTLSLRSSLNFSDQVSHPSTQQKNYSYVYPNLYIFEQQTGRKKDTARNDSKHSLTSV